MSKYKDWHFKALELSSEGWSGRRIATFLGKSKSAVNEFLAKWADDNNESNVVETKSEQKGPRILFLDIETRQLTLEGFALFNQNFSLEQIAEDWSILSVSYKWNDADTVYYHDVSEMTEDELLEIVHKLFDEANFICGHNAKRFDYKKLRARWIARGFKPNAPVRILDTCEIAKSEFSFTSAKLQYLTNLLCKSHKKSGHAKFPGFLLWREFIRGNPEAIEEMRSYNMLDVTSLEELYYILEPWSVKLPNFSVYDDDLHNDWEETGKYVYTNLGKYLEFRNKKTGQYRRGRVNLLSKDQRASLLANIV